MNSERVRVWIGLVTICFVWGSTWLAIKLGLDSVPPFLGVGMRFFLASVIIFVIMRARGIGVTATPEAQRIYLALTFLSYGIPFAIVYWAEQHIASGLGSILFAAFPFWVAIFSHIMLATEKLTPYKLAGVILGFAGLVIIFSNDIHFSSGAQAILAMAGMVVGTMLQGFSTVIVRKYGHHVDILSMNYVGMFFASILLLMLGFATESFQSIIWDAQGIGSILYLAIVGSVVAFLTYYWLLKRIEAVYLSLTTFINPIIAVILGAVVLGEVLPPAVSVGASFVLVGILVANGKSLATKFGRSAKLPTVLLMLCIPLSSGVKAGDGFPFEKRGAFVAEDQGLSLNRVHRKLAYDGPQPFDVLHYEVDLFPAMTSAHLSGTVVMKLVLESAVDSIVINSAALEIDSVLVDGTQQPFALNPQDEELVVSLGSARAQGDTLHIRIAYRRLPEASRPGSRQGYYYFSNSIGLPSHLGYTFSEPSDARFWIPCYDEPWEKATLLLRCTVPDDYVAASNGALLSHANNGDGTVTWMWNETNPIATYLMCITVSEFTLSSLQHATLSNDTIPIQYYTWVNDSASAAAFLPEVDGMMSEFERLFGDYPFGKYGMTSIVPFAYLGMEHQTLSTMNRFYTTNTRVVAHELAHQWWGDVVTCGTWADIWLNESFATYSEALWREHLGGFPALQSYMRDTLQHFFFASWLGAIYNPVGQGLNLFDDVVYSKGAWVLHTMRGVVGDSVFFQILRAYRERWQFNSAVTSELQDVVDSVTSSDMSWFFNQWIYGRGWPKYSLEHFWTGDSLQILVRQLQSDTWPTYRMPLEVRVHHGYSSSDYILLDSLRIQWFAVPLSVSPDSVVLDPDGWVLKQVLPPPNSVAENGISGAFTLFQNYPNPFNPVTSVRFDTYKTEHVSLKVFDVLGREVVTLIEGKVNAGGHISTFDASRLSSGIYLCRLSTSSGSRTVRMLCIK